MVNIARLNQLADEVRSLPGATELDLLADRLRREQKMGQAERAAKDCIKVARGLEAPKCEGIACLSVGLVYHAKGAFELAIRAYEEAQRSLHLGADSYGEALALVALGLAHHDRCLVDSIDQWPSAFVHFKRGVDLLQRAVDQAQLSKQFLDAEGYDHALAKFKGMKNDVFREYVVQLADSSQRRPVRPSPPPVREKATPPSTQLKLRVFPVYDRVAAGRNFTFVDQPIDGYVELDQVEIDGVPYQPVRIEGRQFAVQRLDPQVPHFGLRVKGESMKDIGIETGDVVLIRRSSNPSDGQVAAVRIKDEATLKRIFQKLGYLRLKPENDTEPTIILTRDPQMEPELRQQYPEADGYDIIVESDVEILGVAVAVFKPLE